MKYFILLFSLIILTACSTTKPAATTKEEEPKEQETEAFRIHNIWVLESIAGKKIKKAAEGNKTPQLEIYADKKQVSGNDGCNQIKGRFKVLDEKNIVFGGLVATKIMCPDMKIADTFTKLITQVITYSISDSKLYLYNKEGVGILEFKQQ